MKLHSSHQKGIFSLSFIVYSNLCLFYVVRLKSSFLTLHLKAEHKQMLRLCVWFVNRKHNDRRISIEYVSIDLWHTISSFPIEKH